MRLWAAKKTPEPTDCPYCGKDRDRRSCIDESMANHFLPACAAGPRDDAPEAEKRRFRAWMDAHPETPKGQTDTVKGTDQI